MSEYQSYLIAAFLAFRPDYKDRGNWEDFDTALASVSSTDPQVAKGMALVFLEEPASSGFRTFTDEAAKMPTSGTDLMLSQIYVLIYRLAYLYHTEDLDARTMVRILEQHDLTQEQWALVLEAFDAVGDDAPEAFQRAAEEHIGAVVQ